MLLFAVVYLVWWKEEVVLEALVGKREEMGSAQHTSKSDSNHLRMCPGISDMAEDVFS